MPYLSRSRSQGMDEVSENCEVSDAIRAVATVVAFSKCQTFDVKRQESPVSLTHEGFAADVHKSSNRSHRSSIRASPHGLP